MDSFLLINRIYRYPKNNINVSLLYSVYTIEMVSFIILFRNFYPVISFCDIIPLIFLFLTFYYKMSIIKYSHTEISTYTYNTLKTTNNIYILLLLIFLVYGQLNLDCEDKVWLFWIGVLSFDVINLVLFYIFIREIFPIDSLEFIPKTVIRSRIEECSICLTKIQKREKKVILKCKHQFHYDCIDRWKDIHSNCPNCRMEMV